MRTLVQKSFKAALNENDILISPAAPSPAYSIGMEFYICLIFMCVYIFFFKFKILFIFIIFFWFLFIYFVQLNILQFLVINQLLAIFTGEKKNDPLAMYAGDIMTVSMSR